MHACGCGDARVHARAPIRLVGLLLARLDRLSRLHRLDLPPLSRRLVSAEHAKEEATSVQSAARARRRRTRVQCALCALYARVLSAHVLVCEAQGMACATRAARILKDERRWSHACAATHACTATHARVRDASSARGVRDASSAHACRAVAWERGRGRGEAEADCARARTFFVLEVHKNLCTGRKVPFWKKSGSFAWFASEAFCNE